MIAFVKETNKWMPGELDFKHQKKIPVAYLHSKVLSAPPPPKSNFLHYHAVFGKFWPNNRLGPPFRVGFPLWEILDPLLVWLSRSQSHSVNGSLACVPSLEDWVSLVFEFPALFPVSAAQSSPGCYLLLAAKGEKET